MMIPIELRTERLLLRPWRAGDAAALHPILETNWGHLGPWIPARVATPAPVPELAARLSGFEADFAADREWRYGMFSADAREVLGEIGLYPRSATRRVAYVDADRVEIGYWLRADCTGRGYVTEAARALLGVASLLPRVGCIEVRCDPRNTASAAVPRRLGFTLAATVEDADERGVSSAMTQIWTSEIVRPDQL
jgi:RimJ/RimL family protein N-acetyltransferase